MLSSAALCTIAIATAVNPLTQKSAVCELESGRICTELVYDAEDRRVRDEIRSMCFALGDEDVVAYLKNPKYMVEKVWSDYDERYLAPLHELDEVLSKLEELQDYVPQDSLGEIDPQNNQVETSAQVADRLSVCRDILDKATASYEEAQEAARREAEEAKRAEEAHATQQTDAGFAVSSSYAGNGSGLTAASGVNWYNGRKETYYSSNVLYHYRTSEWWVDSEGFYRTSEGYYVVAASDMAQGTVFATSKGAAMVLDSGCATGVTDFYVIW